ncbi:Bifunctional lysine-specific demethylase and histidyl-hydroxylase NO66 [Sesamum angolense]|uniref:Bifunctional lysine-specific demethylase and histidyl-hydroxylase n=1 Tax=Sesamum angolense TaxID=2727404 RepID=A0AAE2BP74_9LAMI|nr:Bifunctional lysine-specific demethylase and histidyl-hydroxylase NO66 [Sesamum angolense]
MEEQKQQLQDEKMKRKTRFMETTTTTTTTTTKKKKRFRQHETTLFPLLLAALCSNCHNRRALIKKCLNRVLLSLPHLDLSPILSLLPALLKFNCAGIVCKSLEIIGAASLASIVMNEKIAEEGEIMKGLISLLGSSKRGTAMAACNALLDLSTTSSGRQRLVEFSAIENLLANAWISLRPLVSKLMCEAVFVFMRITCCMFVSGVMTDHGINMESKSSSATISPAAEMTLSEEDEYSILLVEGATTLINSCIIEQLQHIPTQLSERFLVLLKSLWRQAREQRFFSSSATRDQGNKFCASNVKTSSIAECIFRLSINYSPQPGPMDFKPVKKSIFNLGEASFEQFLLETWEVSPMLVRNPSNASLLQDSIFSPFIQYLGSKEAIPTFLPSLLRSIISCPAIASDELDILHVIKEINNHLGCPIIYHQDIRVVKTQSGERELHYFQEQSGSSCSLAPHTLSIDDILKCEVAFQEGYSIALRGMEFRYESIAAIADGLASLFGQPSAGVNMYLTPSNSQGLARHSDDHCVFVCQLIGAKRWTIFPRPDIRLPRLYEPCDSLHDLQDESCKVDECQHFLLKEGDVLYIPRGFPHEARTGIDDDQNINGTTGFSLHLTLAIEIEPPFEARCFDFDGFCDRWEGFMQVALYCWDKKQKVLPYKSDDSVPWSLHLLSVKLLHIAIKLIGNHDPGFQKACLVGAIHSKDCLFNNQMMIFWDLISRITSDSKFSDAVEHLEAAIHKNEDPLEHVRWMKHLNEEGEEVERSQSLSISSADSWCLPDLLIPHNRDTAKAAFVHVKSKFCREVEFQDAEQYYKMLLEKYRKVRKQYSNSMLSLHSALHDEYEIISS